MRTRGYRARGHDSSTYPMESRKRKERKEKKRKERKVTLSEQRSIQGEEDVGREGRDGGTATVEAAFLLRSSIARTCRCLLPRFAR